VWDVAAAALIVREAGGTFGPLPRVPDPQLAATIEGGRLACAAFDGAGTLGSVLGGGFTAGNGLVDREVADLWTETMCGGLDAS